MSAEGSCKEDLSADGCKTNNWMQIPSGCMGPPRPNRDKITETTEAVLVVLRDRGLLALDEEPLCQPMAECRRRALWLLEMAVEEVLWQDACENF